MDYYSTNNRELKYGLKEALLKGLAPDRGLFMPRTIPILSMERLMAIRDMNLTEIAVELSSLLFGEDIPTNEAAVQFAQNRIDSIKGIRGMYH